MEQNDFIEYGSYEATYARSQKLELDINTTPNKYRVLTGDRPTGRLHIGHLFGTLLNRARIQNLGVTSYIVIADYQVLTDRDTYEKIKQNIFNLTCEYLAIGLDPEKHNTYIFPHSHVPELNQLLLPFLTLVTNAELDRNPTVKEEIIAAGNNRITAGMYTYPVHQAADILFCKGNVIPVGKDQLPHIELTRIIARRFNDRYTQNTPIFPEPQPLLSKTPNILGLDGDKMSKSRNNAIFLHHSEDETAKLIKKAKTDANRVITYDPLNRPEVSNMLLLISQCSGEAPEKIAERMGDGGGGVLKNELTAAINEYLKPIRARLLELEANPDYIRSILQNGITQARKVGTETLSEVRHCMNMDI